MGHQEKKEIEELQKVEERIRRTEKRERCHHILIAALGLLLVCSVVTGHIGCCSKHHKK